MKRRDFLRSAGVVSAAMAFPKAGRTFVQGTAPEAWRTFDVTTSVQVLKPSGTTRIWMPTALLNPTPFQKTLANDFKAEGGTAKLVEGGADSTGNHRGGISLRRDAGAHGDQPGHHQEFCGGSLRTEQGAERGPRGIEAFSACRRS